MHSPHSLAGSGVVARPYVPMPDRLLKLEQVKAMVCLGKTLIYRMVQAGSFPAPYKPGGHAARWSEQEIIIWLNACAKQRSQ